MATEIITLISSSPPLPMSPDIALYSPSRIKTKPTKTPFKSGSRAAAIPDGAVTGFQSAASAFRSGALSAFAFGDGIVDDGETAKGKEKEKPKRKAKAASKAEAVDDEIVDEAVHERPDGESAPVNTKVRRKANDRKVSESEGGEKRKVDRKTTSKDDRAEQAGGRGSHDEAGTTQEACKTDGTMEREKEVGGQLVKPASKQFRKPILLDDYRLPSPPPTAAPLLPLTDLRLKAAELLARNSRHPLDTSNILETATAGLNADAGLVLEQPPQAPSFTVPEICTTIQDRLKLNVVTEAPPPQHRGRGAPTADQHLVNDVHGPHSNVVDLRASFAYTGTPDAGGIEERPAKRQRLSLEKPQTFKKPVVPKAKSPPKKLTTITALAIANMHHTNDAAPPSKLMATIAQLEPEEVPEEVLEGKKAKPKKARKSKPEPAPPKRLPSPFSAIRRMERQDFVFGTSSQIKDEDMQYRLDLQKALDASEQPQDDSTPLPDPAAGLGRNLWAAGVRGDEGLLMDAELREKRPKIRDRRSAQATMEDAMDEDDFIDIDAVAQGPVSKDGTSKKVAKPATGLKLSSTKLKSKLSSGPSLLSGALMPVSPNKPAAPRSYSSKAGTKEPLPKSGSKPLDITASATKEVGTAEPKPEKKKRKSRAKAATTEADGASPKRPRGRPRKAADPDADQSKAAEPKPIKRKRVSKKQREAAEAAAAKKVAADDIEDDAAPSPSPRRRLDRTVPQPLELSQDDDQPMPEEKTAEEKRRKEIEAEEAAEKAQVELFSEITRVVKSEPRTTNPKTPSWFEKILLYDPIVLEDLTLWLNGKDLRTSDGKELKAVLVQKWCESNSICCLWREGLRGGVKKRY